MKRSKIFSIIIFILTTFLIVGCSMGGEKVSITYDSETFQEEVVVNEFDIREWNIVVNKGSSEELVPVTYAMLSTSDVRKLATVGEYDLTFTYEGASFVFHIKVTEPSEEDILAEIQEAMREDLIAASYVTNFYLPQVSGNVTISWETSSEYVTIKGSKAVITRPEFGSNDAKVTFHATFSMYTYSLEKDYIVVIPALGMEEIYEYLDTVLLAVTPPTSITTSLDLIFIHDDVTLEWTSSSEVITIDNNLKAALVNPVLEDTYVTLTVSLTYKGVVYEQYGNYTIKVIPATTIRIAPKVTNVKLNNSTLTWDAVSGISTYNIYINNVLSKKVTTNRLVLSTIISAIGEYTIGIQSVASGVYNTDSEIYTINYTHTESVSYSGTYYQSVNMSLTGSQLKAALRTLLQNTHSKTLSYDDLKTRISNTDASLINSSKVLLIYSRIEVKGAWSSGGSIWNREHVWPQSKGWFTTSGAGSDLHHLRPEDPSVNTSRGNKPFAEVSNGSLVILSSTNGSVSSNCYGNSSYFEPQDDAKGDVARIIFYLLTRYTESDSYKISAVAQSMELLLEWNELDPVDEWEMTRNDKIESYQGNRNPFIDYPSLAEEIWG